MTTSISEEVIPEDILKDARLDFADAQSKMNEAIMKKVEAEALLEQGRRRFSRKITMNEGDTVDLDRGVILRAVKPNQIPEPPVGE